MVKRMTETAKATGQTGAGLRSVIYGGGPMYQEDIIAAVDHFGPIFIQIYGQGECPYVHHRVVAGGCGGSQPSPAGGRVWRRSGAAAGCRAGEDR